MRSMLCRAFLIVVTLAGTAWAEQVPAVTSADDTIVKRCWAIYANLYYRNARREVVGDDLPMLRARALSFERALHDAAVTSVKSPSGAELIAAWTDMLPMIQDAAELVSDIEYGRRTAKDALQPCREAIGSGTAEAVDPALLPTTVELRPVAVSMPDDELHRCIWAAESWRYSGGVASLAEFTPFYALLKQRMSQSGRAERYDTEPMRIFEAWNRRARTRSLDSSGCTEHTQAKKKS